MSAAEKDFPILAVDDNEADLELISAVLGSDGYTVVSARNGREALEMIGGGGAAVLLIDLTLPDMNGLDILKAAQRANPDAVGIILTASVVKQDAIAAMLDGAFDFLVKPCDSDLLLAAIRRAVSHYQLRKAVSGKKDDPVEVCRDFLADVVHELKNPLSVISGYSTWLVNKPDGGSEQVAAGLKAIQDSATQLQGLVDDFMDAERLRTRKTTLRREPVPVGEFLAAVVSGHKRIAQDRGVELRYGVVGDMSTRMSADYRRLRQVAANLMMNALKFTPSGGRIGIWARVEEEEVVFCVEDSGVGVGADQREKIFLRQYQVHTPLPAGRGLGLGLAIAKELVVLHGGRIWVESSPGQGSRFHFSIPTTANKADAGRFTVLPDTAVYKNPYSSR